MVAKSFEYIPGRYGFYVERTGPAAVAGRIPREPSLTDRDGNLRTAAVLMGVDMTCGMAGGLGVLPNWTVTADADVHLVGACRVGPLRVDATNVRAGRSMSVVEARAVDEGAVRTGCACDLRVNREDYLETESLEQARCYRLVGFDIVLAHADDALSAHRWRRISG